MRHPTPAPLRLERMNDLRNQADAIIRNNILWSVGAGLIPVPLGDLAALTALQISMVEQLAKLYNVEYSETSGKIFVRALTGTTLARLLANYGASLVKFIPGVGTLGGAVAMSIAGGASSYALGQVVVSQFERKVSLDEVDIEQARADYQAEYEEGRKVAKQVRADKNANTSHAASAEATPEQQSDEEATHEEATHEEATRGEAAREATRTSSQDELFSHIEKLADLHQRGILNQEEFEAKKAELLKRL